MATSLSYSEASTAAEFNEIQDTVKITTDSETSEIKGTSTADALKAMKKSAKKEIRELINIAEDNANLTGYDNRVAGRVALTLTIKEMLNTAKVNHLIQHPNLKTV